MNSLYLTNRASVEAAVNWLSPLVGEWMDRLRRYHNVEYTAAMPGAKVVDMVCTHMSCVLLNIARR